jgi:predicted RNA-binding Zn-ribbon protein involved in translation (DUF1610 family)
MATFSAGICAKCNEYILLKDGVPFLVCPMCGATIGFREATEKLNQKCANPDTVHGVIADSIALEVDYGAELPYRILTVVCEHFPRMEEPAYLLVRLSSYEPVLVKVYLEEYSDIKSDKGNVPWAEDFLDTIITYGNMDIADSIVKYIDNKLPQSKKQKYFDRVEKLKKEYTTRASDPKSTKLLYILYIVGACLNILILPALMLTNLGVLLTFLIAMALVSVEMGFMYWHNRVWGNRLGVEGREKLLMVLFLCSMFFALGSGIVSGTPLFKIFGN